MPLTNSQKHNTLGSMTRSNSNGSLGGKAQRLSLSTTSTSATQSHNSNAIDTAATKPPPHADTSDAHPATQPTNTSATTVAAGDEAVSTEVAAQTKGPRAGALGGMALDESTILMLAAKVRELEAKMDSSSSSSNTKSVSTEDPKTPTAATTTSLEPIAMVECADNVEECEVVGAPASDAVAKCQEAEGKKDTETSKGVEKELEAVATEMDGHMEELTAWALGATSRLDELIARARDINGALECA